MASTYSALKIELIATGEQTGTWGSTTNTNLGTALEQAIVGRTVASFTTDGNLTIDLTNTNSTQVARHYILNLTSTGALTATRDLIVPSIDKPYIIENNTTGAQSIRVKTAAGTGVTVPNGKTAMVYANSTNVVSAVSYIPAATIDTATIATAAIAAGTATFSAATITTATINGGTITGITDLAVADGGTGLSTLTANNVILGNGASAPTFVAPSTSGNVLTSNGTTWASTSNPPAFPAGTRIGFQQTAAPTGWTKDTTAAINDSILRLVTGSVTPSGGSVAFSTWNAQTATGGYTLQIADIPAHTHGYTEYSTSGAAGASSGRPVSVPFTQQTGATGGGGSHSHSLTQGIKFYDFIIAAKD
jgi:hypothetical protein